MEITKDEILRKFAKQCGHCRRISSLPFEHEFIFNACAYNVIKRKHKLIKTQRKINKFF